MKGFSETRWAAEKGGEKGSEVLLTIEQLVVPAGGQISAKMVPADVVGEPRERRDLVGVGRLSRGGSNQQQHGDATKQQQLRTHLYDHTHV